MKTIQIAPLLAPMAFGAVTSYICPMAGQRSEPLEAQPPGWVFGVVWPALYLCIGVSWMIARQQSKTAVDSIFLLNMLCINGWIWLNGCAEKNKFALWTFVPSIATALIAMIMVFSLTLKSYGWWPSALLAPYIAWLIFASQLNFAQVNERKSV
jgi:tryptophan-rich sensory protein